MKPAPRNKGSQEVELKLALPGLDPSNLAKRLAQVPLLVRRKATIRHLHNVYYDTPEQILRKKCIALRIRRVGDEANPQWLQTLKTGGRSDSALSQRGEWEVPAQNATLARHGLRDTPWEAIDPDGRLFKALTPAFVTTFERTSWLVHRHDGSKIEIALDIGQIMAGEKSAPICELEIELMAGQPAALFELAQQIAKTIPVIPVNTSKAERGYALVLNCQDTPLYATPPKLTSDLSMPAAAASVLREMYCQFTTNLNSLRTSDDPELVHQARVGWRRFRSGLHLFKPAFPVDVIPSWHALKQLLTSLGKLRDLDVARTSTLPALAEAYAGDDDQRRAAWQAMTNTLRQAAELQRKSVRNALNEPVVGATLLAITQWLEEVPDLNGLDGAGIEPDGSIQGWVEGRLSHMHKQLKVASKGGDSLVRQHRVRILAKRMRYGIEALRAFLPKRRAQLWYQQATSLQLGIGIARDVNQAGALVAKSSTDHGIVEFLRGVATGFIVTKTSHA